MNTKTEIKTTSRRRKCVGVTAVAACALWWLNLPVKAGEVAIDALSVFQRIDGFGSSERVFDDPHVFENYDIATGRARTKLTKAQQDEILDKLYVDLRLIRVRPVSPDTAIGEGIEPHNDNDNPDVIDPDGFNFAWKNLDDHIDYISRALTRGVNTYFLSPLSREKWLDIEEDTSAAEYAEWLLAQALRCQARGVPLPYLSVANEPSYTSNTMPGTFIRDVIKILGPKLRAVKLATRFVIPDDVRSSEAAEVAEIILADPIARSYVGALATHLYDEPLGNLTRMTGLAEQYGLPLWMTENASSGFTPFGRDGFGWANLTHELLNNYGVSAIDYMWAFHGQREKGSQLIVLNHEETGNHQYLGYTLTKEYYMTGQYSRYVAQGARRVGTESDNRHVKATAYVDWPRLTIVVLNGDSITHSSIFSILGLPAVGVLSGVRTSDTENWSSLEPIVVNNASFTATFPARSVTTFTATLPPLRLKISRLPTGVVLSWPAGAAGFVLQATAQLSPTSTWNNVTTEASIVGDQKVVTLPLGYGGQFFRLSKP